MLAAAAGTAAVIGVAGSAAPAFADDGGNTFCFLSTGSISASATGTTSPHPVEIQWSVSAPSCTAFATYIIGPGFTSSQAQSSGGVQFTYVAPGTSASWELVIVDLDSGEDSSYLLGTTSITGS